MTQIQPSNRTPDVLCHPKQKAKRTKMEQEAVARAVEPIKKSIEESDDDVPLTELRKKTTRKKPQAEKRMEPPKGLVAPTSIPDVLDSPRLDSPPPAPPEKKRSRKRLLQDPVVANGGAKDKIQTSGDSSLQQKKQRPPKQEAPALEDDGEDNEPEELPAPKRKKAA